MNKKIFAFIVCTFLLTGCTSNETSVLSSNSTFYKTALSYIDEKQYPQAIEVLNRLGSYKDSKDLVDQIRYVINGSYIAAGWPCIGAVTAKGGVIQINAYENALDTKNWKNVYSLSSQGMYLDGITSDGTFITTNPDTPEEINDSINNSDESIGAGNSDMCAAAEMMVKFQNIKSFISAYPTMCAILTSNNKVEVAGLSVENMNDICLWDNIISIAGFLPDVVGLKADGTIAYLNSRYEGEKTKIATWNNIVAISEGTYLFGLQSDGTVISSGNTAECRTESWNNIISLSASRVTTIGLKSDGTVVAVGDNKYGQCNVDKWNDIVAIAANDYYTLGLTSTGTLVITTTTNINSDTLNIPDVTNVSNLYVPKINIKE